MREELITIWEPQRNKLESQYGKGKDRLTYREWCAREARRLGKEYFVKVSDGGGNCCIAKQVKDNQ